MAIPLSLLLSHAPEVLKAATKLWDTWKARPAPEAMDASSDLKTQLAAVAGRLQTLERGAQDQAELMKSLAEQVAALAAALAEVSKRSNIALALAAGALAASLVAIVLLLMR